MLEGGRHAIGILLNDPKVYGILLSSSLVAALVEDFLFKPALVLKFKPFGPEGVDVEAGSGEAVLEAA